MRREYKMIDWDDKPQKPGEVRIRKRGRVKVIGSEPDNLPYLRIEDGDGVYIGSIEGPTLRHLKNALVHALG